jgi:hypothetical protein
MKATETLSLEQVFEEEYDAVVDMLAALTEVSQDCDCHSDDYPEIQLELIKLSMTEQYLRDRLSDSVPCRFLR